MWFIDVVDPALLGKLFVRLYLRIWRVDYLMNQDDGSSFFAGLPASFTIVDHSLT